jgi:type IV secretion system protein VirB8
MLGKTPFDQAKSFETILSLQKELLANRAWKVCYFLMGVCIFLVVIIFAMALLQEKEIVLIRVDNRTGEAEILTTLTEKEITKDEAISKHFAANYLTLREQYNYFSLQNDYEVVQLFSSPAVKNEYLNIYDRPDSPDNVFGEDFNVKIEIIAISIEPATEPCYLAAIRFKKRITDLKSNKSKEKFYNARITFAFSLQEELTEKVRLRNPLGFKVMSYQVSPELTEES